MKIKRRFGLAILLAIVTFCTSLGVPAAVNANEDKCPVHLQLNRLHEAVGQSSDVTYSITNLLIQADTTGDGPFVKGPVVALDKEIAALQKATDDIEDILDDEVVFPSYLDAGSESFKKHWAEIDTIARDEVVGEYKVILGELKQLNNKQVNRSKNGKLAYEKLVSVSSAEKKTLKLCVELYRDLAKFKSERAKHSREYVPVNLLNREWLPEKRLADEVSWNADSAAREVVAVQINAGAQRYSGRISHGLPGNSQIMEDLAYLQRRVAILKEEISDAPYSNAQYGTTDAWKKCAELATKKVIPNSETLLATAAEFEKTPYNGGSPAEVEWLIVQQCNTLASDWRELQAQAAEICRELVLNDNKMSMNNCLNYGKWFARVEHLPEVVKSLDAECQWVQDWSADIASVYSAPQVWAAKVHSTELKRTLLHESVFNVKDLANHPAIVEAKDAEVKRLWHAIGDSVHQQLLFKYARLYSLLEQADEEEPNSNLGDAIVVAAQECSMQAATARKLIVSLRETINMDQYKDAPGTDKSAPIYVPYIDTEMRTR